MSQLFPIKVNHIQPSPFNSADANTLAIAEDGMDYVVKDGLIAVSEYLCYKIYSACGVAVPEFAILTMPDGRLTFGSRIVIDNSLMSVPPNEKIIWFKSLKSLISSICGLDLLIWNDDRHPNNFLFFKGISGDIKCQAIDFSRAFVAKAWPELSVWSYNNNTAQMQYFLKSNDLWDSAHAMGIINNVSAIKHSTWFDWVDSMPDEWAKPELRFEIKQWWASEKFLRHKQNCLTQAKNEKQIL